MQLRDALPRLDRAAIRVCQAAWLAQAPPVSRLLDAQGLADFCRARSLVGLERDDVLQLWQRGVLRADLVQSSLPLAETEFPAVAGRDGYRLDARPPLAFETWDELLEDMPPLLQELRPLFHPYRLALCAALLTMLRERPAGTLRLYSRARLAARALHSAGARRGEGLGETWEALQTWCDLAVALEPCASDEGPPEPRERHWPRLARLLCGIGEQTLAELHARFCEAALELDGNRDVHLLIACLDRHRRDGLTGALGGCAQLLAIADVIRGSTERALGVALPDVEVGAGRLLGGGGPRHAGVLRPSAERAPSAVRLRALQLGSGVRARCYVEGATELGALGAALRRVPGVAIAALHGRTDGERAAQLAARLREDFEQQVYSYVLLGGESEDCGWLVRQAAEQEALVGGFRVSRPDLELANFARDELCAILWRVIQTDDAMRAFCEEARFAQRALAAQTQDCATASDLFKRLEAVPELPLGRGERWGEALMAFAALHPERCDGAERPLVCLAREIAQATCVPYATCLARLRVDPSSGTLVERKA